MRTILALVVICIAALAWADDPRGYGPRFAAERSAINTMSTAEFAAQFPLKTPYLKERTWDATTGEYYGKFAGAYNFDKELFRKNGFVVVPREAKNNFAIFYYDLYTKHLPVYVTASSILHAWHRTYDSMLERTETEYLAPTLRQLLTGVANHLVDLEKEVGPGALGESVKDVDYFVGTARALLDDKVSDTPLHQEARVAETVLAIKGLRSQDMQLFGRNRTVDFSQFKPRGHYEKSPTLQNYFRAMMWCGRIDFRFAGKGSAPRELGAALVMAEAMQRSLVLDKWRGFDRTLQVFVGRADSLNVEQIQQLTKAAKVKDFASLKEEAALKALQERILNDSAGVQQIASETYISPMGGQAVLPRSFTLLGQRFTMDSWAMGQVVYDEIVRDGKKIPRRIPSCLDVGFSVFGNDHLAPLIAKRIDDKEGRKFRDGQPYQENLVAVRRVIDSLPEDAWQESIYTEWLGCLRELSRPTTGPEFPESLRTEAWAMNMANTQFASWSQLRHDSILYVKQSYTRQSECLYPAGYVEPYPEFWRRLEKMLTRSADLLVKLDASPISRQQAGFLRTFASRVSTIHSISEKQRDQKELTGVETTFLKQVVSALQEDDGRSSGPRYDGWYFDLFYASRKDANVADFIVADVHTDVPDPLMGDPGCILHQGLGKVDLLVIAIENGPHRMVYGGPVLSHYEFEAPINERLSDSEWKNRLQNGKLPPRQVGPNRTSTDEER
jgi:hypothetical protein